VPITPDGRITFLQARDITAAGLTLTNCERNLNEALGKFYQNARVSSFPLPLTAKNYFLLGSVLTVAFTFRSSLTVIKPSSAGGLETGFRTTQR